LFSAALAFLVFYRWIFAASTPGPWRNETEKWNLADLGRFRFHIAGYSPIILSLCFQSRACSLRIFAFGVGLRFDSWLVPPFGRPQVYRGQIFG